MTVRTALQFHGGLGAGLSQAWAYVFTGAMVLFSLFPVYWVLTVSLKSRRDGLASPPLWIFDPTTPTTSRSGATRRSSTRS